MGQFVLDRWDQIWFASVQHLSLVLQCLVLAVVIAVALAMVVYRNGTLRALANGISAVGLTIPAFALIGLLIAPLGFGVLPSVVLITFFATLPILRNAVVGLLIGGVFALVGLQIRKRLGNPTLETSLVLLLPFTIVGPWAGVFLDRWRRQRVLLAGNLIRAVLAVVIGLIILTVGVNPVVYVLALVTLSVNRFLLAAMSASQ